MSQVLLIDWGLRKYDIPDIEIKPLISKNTPCNARPKKQHHNFRNGKCKFCGLFKGQYGLEPSYTDYIEHTSLWAREAWRVLENDGIFFLNLGDTYSGSGGAGGDYNKGGLKEGQPKYKQGESELPAKCKMLIPHRVAIALIEDGWILRNDIVWAKNAMPESCKDRFSKRFEYIFMFVKQQKYYFDLDAVREPYGDWIKKDGNRPSDMGKSGKKYKDKAKYGGGGTSFQGHSGQFKANGESMLHEKGRNPTDIWQINTQPSPEHHFAMWPEKLVERMILCSTKIGDTVLDPFCGSGTTLLVAEILNRESFGIDLGYKDIQEKRLNHIQKELPIKRN